MIAWEDFKRCRSARYPEVIASWKQEVGARQLRGSLMLVRP